MTSPNPAVESSSTEADLAESHLANPDEIVNILMRLLTAGTLINIQIEGAERRYTSAFLSINSKANSIELDELVPTKANQGLQKGTTISVSSKLNGVTVWFKTRIIRTDSSDRILRHVVMLPESIIYRERRDDFRCPLSNDMVVHLRGKHPVTGNNLFGSLIDISSTGCAFKLSGNEHHLNRGITLRPVTLIFPDDTSIHMNMCIQNQTITRQTKSIRYGAEFQFRDTDQKKLVAKLVLNLQRQAQRDEEL